MNVNILIDAIVRQTTVLIAQLATAAGVRAPLAQTANQVFLELVRELKRQGLGNKVIADMFGLALSTYHTKIRRLSESRSDRGRSLWEATLAHVRQCGTVSQTDVLLRFKQDDEAIVRGVLLDLVESGLVFRTGRGDRTSYRAAQPDELSQRDEEETRAGLVNLVWLATHRNGSSSLDELMKVIPLDRAALESALQTLVLDGRATRTETAGEARYSADECVIALGEPGGWEAAVFDHYQAMVVAMCTKLRRAPARAKSDDAVGGSTFGFTVWPGHPHHDDVLTLLARLRREATELRRKVRDYNADHDAPDGETVGVITYVGQTVIESETTEEIS